MTDIRAPNLPIASAPVTHVLVQDQNGNAPVRIPVADLLPSVGGIVNFAIGSFGQSNAGSNKPAGAWTPPGNLKEWNWNGNVTSTGTAFVTPDAAHISMPRAVGKYLAEQFPQMSPFIIPLSLSGVPIEKWTSGLQYNYQNITTAADPGTGNFRLNHANPGLALKLYVSARDIWTTWRIAAWNFVGATIKIYKQGDEDGTYVTYEAESRIDHSTWQEWTVSAVDQSGTFTDEMDCRIKFDNDMRVVNDNNVPAALAHIGKDKLDMVLWWQGESDTAFPQGYVRDFDEVLSIMRAQGFITYNTPIVVCGVVSKTISGDVSRGLFNIVLQEVVNVDPDHRTFVYPASLPAGYWDPSGSHLHPTAAGYFLVGEMIVNAVFRGLARKVHQGLFTDLDTGDALMPDGTDADPGIAFRGNQAAGLYRVADGVGIAGQGWTVQNNAMQQMNPGGTSAVWRLYTEAISEITSGRWSDDGSSGFFRCLKGRGTIASPDAVHLNDIVGMFDAMAQSDTPSPITVTRIKSQMKETTPSSDRMGSRIHFQLTPQGDVGLQDTLILDCDAGLLWGTTSNIVIDNDRLLRTRIYTVGTLPTAGKEGRSAGVTDANGPTYRGVVAAGGSSNCRVYDNGINWICC